MKTRLAPALFLALALLLVAGPAAAAPEKADAATTIALKRVSDRYALTKTRISALLDQRLNPSPLPTTLPNPFYRSPDLPPTDASRGVLPGGPADSNVPPAGPDESDADTLAKFVATLKVSGVTVLNGRSLLTLNQTLCKAGDTIPLEIKGHTVYIQVLKITADELTLRLNEDEQVVRLKK